MLRKMDPLYSTLDSRYHKHKKPIVERSEHNRNLLIFSSEQQQCVITELMSDTPSSAKRADTLGKSKLLISCRSARFGSV